MSYMMIVIIIIIYGHIVKRFIFKTQTESLSMAV